MGGRLIFIGAATEDVLQEKVFFQILQNSLENSYARVSFIITLQASGLQKKTFWHRCFPMNFAKFLSIPFLQNTSGRLLLFLK